MPRRSIELRDEQRTILASMSAHGRGVLERAIRALLEQRRRAREQRRHRRRRRGRA